MSAPVSLADKYTLEEGSVYLSGTQALVRLLLEQKRRDALAGLNTAGFVSGYRGSPLGALDQQLWAAHSYLQSAHIVFQPGLNEDLAATSVWGSQQTGLLAPAKVQGVFGMWYGKGPGVDRCGDVFKHANAAGTSAHGGVLAVAGDDHAAKSSTLPHQSDHIFKACLMPVLFPASVQDIVDLGLHGYAMSRYAGVWVGFKCVSDIVESSARIEVGLQRINIKMPTDFDMPAGGLSIRWPDAPLDIEARILDHKLYAALAYARANRLNFTVIDSPHPRIGLVASGKAYVDTCQALSDLGLTADACSAIGLRLYKVGMVWPLEPQGIRAFASGLEEILVIEEKRQVLEYQIKEELYNWDAAVRPRVYGKFDERPQADGRAGGEWTVPQAPWLLPAHHELNPALIARAVATRLERIELPSGIRERMAHRLREIEEREALSRRPHPAVMRTPYFCSGCPHNTSTRIPEGSKAIAGIGCHYMAVWMGRDTCTYTQMGGEGVPWIGQAPFTDMPHVFANLGDGTYFHSGLLAIRASVSAKVNITYKILFNDAVAMTGGQTVDGELDVPRLTQQVAAEGVARIVVVTDDTDRYAPSLRARLAPGTDVFDRRELDAVQRQLRDTRGVTVLVYDQTCAAEKRRRRKRFDADGKPQYPDPARRVVINPAVCEGCGDCSTQSNCLSVEPLQTEFGVKRRINQSTCNKDFSCLEGLCPSLVTVEGGQLRRTPVAGGGGGESDGTGSVGSPVQISSQSTEFFAFHALPQPPEPVWNHLDAGQGRYSLLVTGVGGTGVVTIGALLGMAAHIEGRAVAVLDMAGLAQKGGAVFSHVQIARTDVGVMSTRIPTAEADVLIGGDLVVSAGIEALTKLSPRACIVVNTDVSPTADFIHRPDEPDHADWLHADLLAAVGDDASRLLRVPAQRLMSTLLGDTLYVNAFLLGAAWQKGWVPLSRSSLLRAIELNGVQAQRNAQAFEWGRSAAFDPDAVEARVGCREQVLPMPQSAARRLKAFVAAARQQLKDYDGEALAQRFEQAVLACEQKEAALGAGREVTLQFAQTYLQVLWVKDEYEVARLHTDPAFRKLIEDQFEGDYEVVFHFAPPAWASEDSRGRPLKTAWRGWKVRLLPVLARMRFLRGTAFDVFARSPERQVELAWVVEFENAWRSMQHVFGGGDISALREMLGIFQSVKGYGAVRHARLQTAQSRLTPLLHRIKLRHDEHPET